MSLGGYQILMPVRKYRLLFTIVKGVFVNNWFIALCSASWYASSCLVLNKELTGNNWVVTIFVFWCTILMYNLDRVFGDEWPLVKSFSKALTSKKVAFEKSHAKVVIQLLFLIPVLALLSFIPQQAIISLIIPSIIAVFYALPVLPNGARMRELPYVKIFAIAFVWAWLGSFLVEFSLASKQALLFCAHFLFIFAITIPFDLRDQVADAAKSMVTVPIRKGTRFARNAARIALLLAILIVVIDYRGGGAFYWSRVFTYLVAFYLVERWNENKKWWYYLFFLDGCILLGSLAIFAEYYS